MFYPLLRNVLFQMDPEHAHEWTLNAAKLAPALGKLGGAVSDPRMATKAGNCVWTFPVGLAAGLDKNAEALSFFANQGFGALECGTITLRPQDGNPRPRIWRYPPEESLRNAMGFPNQGVQSILKKLHQKEISVPVGANIGKNKDTTAQDSIEELLILVETLYDDVDYFVINVSSPNTPGLRALQEKSYLDELFVAIKEARKNKDLYLKIAPDLEESKVIELTQIAVDHKLTGIIATNTTVRPELGPGGISGRLLSERARSIRNLVLKQDSTLEVIGVGGISSTEDLFEFWSEGGKAAQIYTAYVFQGPSILKNIHRDIKRMLDRHQFKDLAAFFSLGPSERKKALT